MGFAVYPVLPPPATSGEGIPEGVDQRTAVLFVGADFRPPPPSGSTAPVTEAAEILVDPGHPDFVVAAFDDTTAEAVVLGMAVPDLSFSIVGMGLRFRLRQAPSADVDVSWSLWWREVAGTSGWTVATVPSRTVTVAEADGWVEHAVQWDTADLPVARGMPVLFLLSRDPSGPSGDVHLASVTVGLW